MKKFFALLLVVLMLLPCVVACGGNPDDTGSSGSESGSDDAYLSADPGDLSPNTNTDNNKKWDGKTLNILANTWWTEGIGTPSKWSMPELYVKGYGDTSQYGMTINDAVWERQEYIQETYGVTLNWIMSVHTCGNLVNDIKTSLMTNSGTKYHIAFPRVWEAQNLVTNGVVYDIGSSPYIDLSQSYYNQIANEAYRVHDKQFFVGGDFSFMDERTSYVIFYNSAMLGEDGEALYHMALDGGWTIDQMIQYANVYEDLDTYDGKSNGDKFGFGTTTLSKYFQTSGIQQVTVIDGEYKLTLNDNNSLVSGLIDKFNTITGQNWCNRSWNVGEDEYGSMETAFTDGRLVFFDEVVEKFDRLESNDKLKLGVLPMPKYSTETQDSYYSPCASQSTVMCIPTTTDDMRFSEYFFEVLAITGQDYIMSSYKETLKATMDSEYADLSMRVLEECVFANIVYDQGFMQFQTSDPGLTAVQGNAFSGTGNASSFTTDYITTSETAGEIIKNWNDAYKNYTPRTTITEDTW